MTDPTPESNKTSTKPKHRGEPEQDESRPGSVFSHEPSEIVAIGDPGSAASRTSPSFSGPAGSPPDSIADGANIGSLRVRAASVRGIAHRVEGLPRQDSFAIALSDGGEWLLLAVADGVSGSPESHWGAAVASQRAVEALNQAIASNPSWKTDWTDVISAASSAVLERARQFLGSAELDERGARGLMATTLLVGAVSIAASEDGAHGAHLAVVDDCSAIVLDSSRAWHPVSAIKGFTNGEANEVQTSGVKGLPSVLPDFDVLEASLSPGDALFVMTDGVGDPVGNGTNSVAHTLSEWWSSPPTLLRFAAEVGFARRTYTDDRTAVGVWVGQPGATD